jgi:hypothetical protein
VCRRTPRRLVDRAAHPALALLHELLEGGHEVGVSDAVLVGRDPPARLLEARVVSKPSTRLEWTSQKTCPRQSSRLCSASAREKDPAPDMVFTLCRERVRAYLPYSMICMPVR